MPQTEPLIVTETRYDRGELLSARAMPNGMLLVEARVAVPGVMPYLRQDGTTQLELISAEQLHSEDSLQTLGRVSTTLEHPPEDVTPRNVARFGVGDVDGRVNVDADGFVVVKMAVRRDEAIAAIRKGKREVSPGYKLRLDMTGGVHPEFGRYDAEQLDRVYNHVAIVEQARGGPEIRLNVDGYQVATRTDSTYEIIEHEDTMDPRLAILLEKLGVTRVDDEKSAINEAIANVKKTRTDSDNEKVRLDAEAEEFAKMKTDLAEVTAERDKFAGELEGLNKAKKDAEEEEEANADAADRLELNKLAVTHKVEHADSVDNAALRRSLAAKLLNREIREDESDDMIRGVITGATRDRSMWAGVNRDAGNRDKETREDAVKKPPASHSDSYYNNSDEALKRARGGV